MANHQFDTTSSTFKAPLAPIRPLTMMPGHAETLLFNDIMEDKTMELRNTMTEFLQVQPFRKFEFEFSNFLKRVKGIIEEGQRSGANATRLTNVSHIAPMYSRPSMSFNCRPSSTISMISTNRQSAFRLPETNYQPIEPLNPFKPPTSVTMRPNGVLPCIDDLVMSTEGSSRSSKLRTTVVELNEQMSKESQKSHYDTRNQTEEHEPELHEAAIPNAYSDMTIIENTSTSRSQHNTGSQNKSNSVESLLEGVGFKIVVGLPNKTNCSTKTDHTSQLNIIPQNQLNNLTKNIVKYLSMWSVNLKQFTHQKNVKAVLVVSGTLIAEDKVTTLEEGHDAGILETRKEKNLIKTKNGIYRLMGNIVRGHPKDIYNICCEIQGIPKNWKLLIRQSITVKKVTEKQALNFSLESPAGPVKSSKPPASMNASMTRKGTTYNSSFFPHKEVSCKRKFSEYDSTAEHGINKQQRYQIPLLASTPKRPKLQPSHTPSQLLKKKLCHKLNSQNAVANCKSSKTLDAVNDSIVVKKKQSLTKQTQENNFLKPQSLTPIDKSSKMKAKTTAISTKCKSKQTSSDKSSLVVANCSNQSRQESVNNLNVNSINSIKQSRSKTQDNFSMNSTNKSLSKLKLTNTNSTTSSVELVKQHNSKTSLKNCSQKENIINHKFLKNDSVLTKTKLTKQKAKELSKKQLETTVFDEKPKNHGKKKRKNEVLSSVKNSSQQGGLFDDLDVDGFGEMSNFNIMESPGKLSLTSRTDKSRSVTPPLFNQNWAGSSAKSIVISEPPTPLSKSIEAKALKKRVKAPKITLEEELKVLKRHKTSTNKHKTNEKDYKAVAKIIDNMLIYDEKLDNDNDEINSYSC
ncbi:uncharacterized protein LOC126838133 [Adelges cooleyi]|uniref:uncharacterized protein LOC126838133 n=1 Tax=Adelges cooleyi TaxID=133065 RepID=UPI00217F8496|nr:uncharacterized protein LOC126838133 [Adelges cooleyi]XP_050428243.1 uncharacterized protein LOC126838133 [Adelges cooleyi]